MSKGSTSSFTPSCNQTPATSQANPHTSECVGASCQQMAQSECEESRAAYFPKRESTPFSRRNTAVDTCRRHSVDGATIGSGSCQRSGRGSDQSGRFHPYRRQYSDEGSAGCVAPSSHPFICLNSFSETHTGSSHQGEQPPWETYSGLQVNRLMDSQHTFPEPPGAPEEPSCFLSSSHATYNPLAPLQQFSPGTYSASRQSNSSPYSLQCLSTPPLQDSPVISLFPKPVYSYSILIFMALRNSKTGSLPVSEIYSFMTENFPYFKTAPDGWKNSVRHNLSLNKCFEKVENKSGNSSRKGCLWALNPAKVEKMQEELHKWRRKDPLTVRKSMARPEDLDRLLGEKPNKLKSISTYHSQNSTSRPSSHFTHSPSSFPLPQPCLPPPCPLHSRVPSPSLTAGQHPQSYLPASAPHPFPFYASCVQQPSSGVPSTTVSLDSPLVGQMPQAYSTTLQVDCGVGPKSMQELLMDGDTSNDIDMLNPSLTDLQIHGNLWEQLREDSLAPDSLVVITSTTPISTFPSYLLQGSSLPSANHSSEVIAIGRGNPHEDKNMGLGCDPDHQMNGLYTTAFPVVENLALYRTSTGTTPIPLL
ncbi:forkhead box protein N1 [Osmerus mordax]|uniref:forkhead box protein N1 n=1 Tax=Osmerus mordax TaxID=8014 RepID=UPI00350EC8AC